MASKRTYLFITRPEAPWASTEVWVRAATYASALREAELHFDEGDLDEEDLECYVLPRDVWHQRRKQSVAGDIFLRVGSIDGYGI